MSDRFGKQPGKLGSNAERVKPLQVLAELEGDGGRLIVIPLHDGKVALKDGRDFSVIELSGVKTTLPGILDVRPLSSDGKLVWLDSQGCLVSGRFEEASRSLLADSSMHLKELYSEASVADAIARTEKFCNLRAVFEGGNVRHSVEILSRVVGNHH